MKNIIELIVFVNFKNILIFSINSNTNIKWYYFDIRIKLYKLEISLSQIKISEK